MRGLQFRQRLEIVCTLIAYRGFESLSLRQSEGLQGFACSPLLYSNYFWTSDFIGYGRKFFKDEISIDEAVKLTTRSILAKKERLIKS